MPQPPPSATKATWIAKAHRDLRGKDPATLNFTLAGRTYTPFHHREDQPHPPQPLREGNPWKIGVRITEADPEKANQLALQALMGGAEAVWFTRPGATAAPLAAELDALLKDILTDIVDIRIDIDDRSYPTTPLAHQITSAVQSSPGSFPLSLRGCLRRWGPGGENRRPRLYPPTDPNFFLTLATFRAARRCWRSIAENLDEERDCELIALVPAALENVHTNKIAQTVTATAAILGGADVVYIEPSDPADATAFSARIARNVQHLLREESGLGRVGDPAAGSYFFETLTEDVYQDLRAHIPALQ